YQMQQLLLSRLKSLFSLRWSPEAKVVSSFEECKGSFHHGSEPEGFDSRTRVIRICQKKDNVYHFATLYSPEYRIPVYAAYNYTNSTTRGRCPNCPWLIEPQPGSASSTESEACGGAGENQALDSDYTGYNRGHLNPVCLNPRNPEATFTLTNAVPMNKTQNINWYWYSEHVIRNHISHICINGQLYLVTGTLPSKKFTQNGRVSVPTVVWTAVCCSAEWDQVNGLGYDFSFALIQSNIRLPLENLIDIGDQWVAPLTVELLQTILGEQPMGWGRNLTIFPDRCQWREKVHFQ
uniref:DNA/RNA non-specific endonuclease domain-containing protein n=1 Tax=Callorhinchus milii TaxID=7868 RepID=A0A4W3GC72_CALMI